MIKMINNLVHNNSKNKLPYNNYKNYKHIKVDKI